MRKFFLYLTTFITGAAGMIVEFSAIRLISPFFGSSIKVWSIIIAVIMAALSCGYFLGGALSQKYKKPINMAYLFISFSGLFVGLSYLLIEPIISFTTFSLKLSQLSLSLKTLLVVIGLFFLPVFILGSIYPMIISGLKNQKSGQASGTVFAISTFGSILGSFLPSFVLIPLIGAKNTFFVTGIVLELIAFLGLTRWSKILPVFVLMIFTLIAPQNLNKAQIQSNIIYQADSSYQRITVIKKNNALILSLGDNNYVSSYYSPDNYLTGLYYDFYNLLPFIGNFGKDLDILIIGLGGGTIARQYDHFFSKSYNLKIDGIEIDPEVIKVGKKFFDLENPSLNIIEIDGRVFLNQTRKKYDLIIIDVYARQSYIPFHVVTQEFIKLTKSHLNENGVLAFNVSAYSTDEFRFKAISNTVKSVYENSYYYNPYDTANFMILASPSSVGLLKNDLLNTIPPELENILGKFKITLPTKIKNVDPRFILKDDTAPEKI